MNITSSKYLRIFSVLLFMTALSNLCHAQEVNSETVPEEINETRSYSLDIDLGISLENGSIGNALTDMYFAVSIIEQELTFIDYEVVHSLFLTMPLQEITNLIDQIFGIDPEDEITHQDIGYMYGRKYGDFTISAGISNIQVSYHTNELNERTESTIGIPFNIKYKLPFLSGSLMAHGNLNKEENFFLILYTFDIW